jgi:creatinine amidohydrolase
MFPDELDAALERFPVVYLTYGLCEPHGLHNAIGLDGLKAHALGCWVAEEYGGVVAPPSYWHVHEIGYHALFGERYVGDRNPWLTAVPPWVLYKLFFFQLRAVAARGFHAAVVITGHYGGNEQDFKRVAGVFAQYSPLRVWAGADSEAIAYQDFHGDHAGRCETSQLWALRPELVDMSRLVTGSPEAISRVMATGPDAALADRRVGERIVSSQVAWLGRKARELLAEYRPPLAPAEPTPGNPSGALTFAQTERLWRSEVEPLLPEFTSMNCSVDGERVAPESVWAPNEMGYHGL